MNETMKRKIRILPNSIPLLHPDILTEYKQQPLTETEKTKYECSICYEVYDSIIITNCQHQHCRNCLRNWTQIKKECPLCRTILTKCIYQYHQ